MRVGFGFDAHRLIAGRPLVLAGCQIPFDKGLEGFSDGDVAAHAIIDAILGAAALGDCGKHFPAGQAEFAGIKSVELLRRATVILSDNGYNIENIDCTIVTDQPPLAGFIEAMIENVVTATHLTADRCSVKAKRSEGLGFTGEGRGMAAFAVACVRRA